MVRAKFHIREVEPGVLVVLSVSSFPCGIPILHSIVLRFARIID